MMDGVQGEDLVGRVRAPLVEDGGWRAAGFGERLDVCEMLGLIRGVERSRRNRPKAGRGERDEHQPKTQPSARARAEGE